MKLHSLRCYVGEPKAGKTYLALQHLQQLMASSGAPGIVIDSIGARNFVGMRRAGSLQHLLQWTYGVGGLTVWTPDDVEQLELLRRATKAAARPVHILVDEASVWIRGSKLVKPLDLMARTLQHADASLSLTTQNFTSDCGRALLSLGPQIFIFKISMELPAVVRWRLSAYGVNCAKLPLQRVGEYQVFGGS